MKPPSDIGVRVLAYFQTNPAPAIREIMRACNISSTSVVNYWLRRYARDGVLVQAHDARTARRYRLADSPPEPTRDELTDAVRNLARGCVDYGGAYVAVKREAFDALREAVRK